MSTPAPTTTEPRSETEHRYMVSLTTGNLYLVTEWVELGEGRFQALEKEVITEPPLGYTLPSRPGIATEVVEDADQLTTVSEGDAIGFCPECTSNARMSTSLQGVFNCSHCPEQWLDTRTGVCKDTIEMAPPEGNSTSAAVEPNEGQAPHS